MPFGQWRRLVQLHAPLPQLAVGQAVTRSPGTSAMRRPAAGPGRVRGINRHVEKAGKLFVEEGQRWMEP
jgi:hypothetical protein